MRRLLLASIAAMAFFAAAPSASAQAGIVLACSVSGFPTPPVTPGEFAVATFVIINPAGVTTVPSQGAQGRCVGAFAKP